MWSKLCRSGILRKNKSKIDEVENHNIKKLIIAIAMSNILNNNKTFYTLLSILGIWHLWSLLYSPLPWFDETFYVSITRSLLEGKGFMLQVCPIQTEGKEVLTYGPIYFLLTGLSFSIFSFGIFQFRIVALLFTALSIFVFSKILKQLSISKSIIRLLILLLAFDVIIIQNGHSGRMDMVALFFALTAWWAYLKGKTENKYSWFMALAGVVAVLTTPRIAVIIFPLFVYALIIFFKTKNWYRATIITVLPASIYFVWILYAFGSINGFIEHFITPASESSDPANNLFSYLGGNLYIPLYQWPLIISSFISAMIILFSRKNRSILLLLSLPIITFYIVVADTGAYSALIMPFWYLIIALGLTHYERNNKLEKWLLHGGIAIILFVCIGIFSLKAATIIGSQSDRNPRPLQTWVNNHIPKNSRIVGDDRYYYACIKNNCDYQYMDRVKDHATRAKYHLDNFQPDYLFISTQTPKEIINAYNKEFDFLESWDYIPQKGNSFFKTILNHIPIPIQSSYQGTLIRVTPRGGGKL